MIIYRFKGGRKIYKKLVYTDYWEGDFSQELREIAQLYEKENIMIGSYPTMNPESKYKVMLTIEGFDEQKIEDVTKKVVECTKGRLII